MPCAFGERELSATGAECMLPAMGAECMLPATGELRIALHALDERSLICRNARS